MLVVLDGFGIGDGGASDATAVAHTPFFERIRRDYPIAKIETSGSAVGLPPGQMGNSEVGHMTMGSGRVIDQNLTRISKAFAAGEIDTNLALSRLFDGLAQSGGSLHLVGLLSDGGVHSHQEHLYALLEACGRRAIEPVVHAILDGRDTAPRSGLAFMQALLPRLEAANGHVSTVIGRYFAMDRDNRWDRIYRAYHAVVCREGLDAADPVSAIEASYARDESDEFVQPTLVAGGRELRDGDAILFFNFRADRARELTNAFTSARPEAYEGKLERKRVPALSGYVCLTEYDAEFPLEVAFRSQTPPRILGEVLADRGRKQLRAAETEKYAHVTFFFNAGREDPFPGEERVLIASPQDVATYDHKPEMSALPLTETLLGRFAEGEYDFVLVNYANPDMVGHTGMLDATVKAVETIDSCLERVVEAVLERGGQVLITADHGNCEQMIDPETGEPHTAHTTNPVPLHWITRHSGGKQLRDGGLADLAPTVLSLLEIPVPDEMTGRSLIG
jgi:2,3-bisphosphoglycerate-independent phosphoglycerate mutase